MGSSIGFSKMKSFGGNNEHGRYENDEVDTAVRSHSVPSHTVGSNMKAELDESRRVSDLDGMEDRLPVLVDMNDTDNLEEDEKQCLYSPLTASQGRLPFSSSSSTGSSTGSSGKSSSSYLEGDKNDDHSQSTAIHTPANMSINACKLPLLILFLVTTVLSLTHYQYYQYTGTSQKLQPSENSITNSSTSFCDPCYSYSCLNSLDKTNITNCFRTIDIDNPTRLQFCLDDGDAFGEDDIQINSCDSVQANFLCDEILQNLQKHHTELISYPDAYCHCRDPSIATPRVDFEDRDPKDDFERRWLDHHQTMLNDIAFQQQLQQPNHQNTIPALDFVLLGDSITEHWNGTKSLGNYPAPDYRAVFDKYFSQAFHNSSIDQRLKGIALGSSGDITTELLWHLQNGILPTPLTETSQSPSFQLNPRVWVVLIGTNDIGRVNCSKHSVLQGITSVLHYINDNMNTDKNNDTNTNTTNTKSQLLVHALLPRSDYYNHGQELTDYTVGIRMYNHMILWINQQLKLLCQNYTHWHYLDIGSIFLINNTDDVTNNTNENEYNNNQDNNFTTIQNYHYSHRPIINQTLMEDGLHPTAAGYDLWGPLLTKKIRQIIGTNN